MELPHRPFPEALRISDWVLLSQPFQYIFESRISRYLVAFAALRNRKLWEHYLVVIDRNIEALRADSLSYESRLACDEAFQSVHLRFIQRVRDFNRQRNPLPSHCESHPDKPLDDVRAVRVFHTAVLRDQDFSDVVVAGRHPAVNHFLAGQFADRRLESLSTCSVQIHFPHHVVFLLSCSRSAECSRKVSSVRPKALCRSHGRSCGDLSVHLDCQLADSAAVDSIFLARLIVMLHPLMTYGVSVLVPCIRDSDCSFAPHGVYLLCFW